MSTTSTSELLDVEVYFEAAEDHADGTGEWEHQIDDLENLIRHIWDHVLRPEQRLAFARSEFAREFFELAAPGFDYASELKKLG